MAVTQKQIAEKLNISTSLVARALMGHKEVAEGTRTLVQQVARDMGYNSTSSREARAMAARRHGRRVRNGVVAILYHPGVEDASQTSLFFDPVLRNMHAEASRHGFEVCLFPCPADALPRFVRERSVDGVIFLTLSQDFVPAMQALDLPVVLFQDRCEIAHSVNTDDRHGSYLATRHLLEQGHRRIAFLGVRNTLGRPSAIRLQGYLDAMREFGVDVPEEWICNDLWASIDTESSERADTAGWMTLMRQNNIEPGDDELPFTGLVCYNDTLARSAITQIRQFGWNVPEDISVTGFDNTSDLNFRPLLTSVSYDRGELGRAAIDILVRAIEKAERSSGISGSDIANSNVASPEGLESEYSEGQTQDTIFEHIIVETSIAVRESTCPPKEVPLLTEAF